MLFGNNNMLMIRLKIFVTLILVLLFVIVFSRDYFANNTPKPRLPIKKYIAEKFNLVKESYVARTETKKVENIVAGKSKEENTSFNMISKGVYAQNKNGYTKTIIKVNEVSWEERVYIILNSEGKEKKVTIKIPVGSTVKFPSQEEVENDYK